LQEYIERTTKERESALQVLKTCAPSPNSWGGKEKTLQKNNTPKEKGKGRDTRALRSPTTYTKFSRRRAPSLDGVPLKGYTEKKGKIRKMESAMEEGGNCSNMIGRK